MKTTVTIVNHQSRNTINSANLLIHARKDLKPRGMVHIFWALVKLEHWPSGMTSFVDVRLDEHGYAQSKYCSTSMLQFSSL